MRIGRARPSSALGAAEPVATRAIFVSDPHGRGPPRGMRIGRARPSSALGAAEPVATRAIYVSGGRRSESGCSSQSPAPLAEPGALEELRSEWRSVVEVAALGLPLPTVGAFAVAALLGAFDLGGSPLEGGADLVGFQLGHRPLVALGGLPAALAESAGDHDPVALGQGVGQVLGLVAPDVDLEEAGVASRHWPSCWMRWVTATRRLVTAMPLEVKRTSGSSTRLPTMVVWLSAAMTSSLSMLI